MKKTIWIALMVAVLLLCGCQSQPDPDAISFEGKPTLPVEEITELPTLVPVNDGSESNWGFELETEIGIFCQEDVEGDGIYHFLLTFEDSATGETYPLCPKINCTHDNLNCPAFGHRYKSMYYDGPICTWLGPNIWSPHKWMWCIARIWTAQTGKWYTARITFLRTAPLQ